MQQEAALQILKQGHCVFLTGQAGAGKTYVLNQYIRYLREQGVPVAVTATTGIAASQMNGQTIHSWAGIGIKDQFSEDDFKKLTKRDDVIFRLKIIKVIVIDEISMLHARQLDLIDEVLRFVRQTPEPFGGVQMVFSGDFFQLPPIGKKEETTKDKFAFMSKAWIDLATTKYRGIPMIKVCYLSTQHRQNSTHDGDTLGLNEILNQIRSQTISRAATQALLATQSQPLPDPYTRLYTHNSRVDEINQEKLEALPGKIYAFESYTFGEAPLVEVLKKNVRAYDVLYLKKGAKVMFVKNNAAEHVYNGTLGEVIDFVKSDDGERFLPKVRLDNGRTVLADTETWEMNDEEGMTLASFSQVPLVLAWAITVHKSQGMTLSAAEVDLSNTFEMGQGYVALSRMRTLSGLRLLGMNHKSLLLDDFARAADRRFLELSQECLAWFLAQNEQQKQKACADFLQRSIVAAFAPKSKGEKKLDVQSSLNKTQTLIGMKKTFTEMAKMMAVSQSVIVEHIRILLDEARISVKDIAYLAPNYTILQRIDEAKQAIKASYATQKTQQKVGVLDVYDKLGGAVDMHVVRFGLVLLALDDKDISE